MTKGLTGAVVLSLGLAAGAAQAQEFSFEGNIGLVSNYVSSGYSLTDGRPALQFTGTAYLGNFYAGLFASNVNFGTADRLELVPFIGFFYEFDMGVTVDLGYEHYYYNSTGSDGGGVYLGASSFIGESLWLEGRVLYETSRKVYNTRGTVMFYPSDSIGLRAVLGRVQSNQTYFSVGADYYVTDTITASLDFHRGRETGYSESAIVAGISFEF
jgi:uncharacterized protein (TIGR02001 family)